jgi:hypothetical protein
MQGKNGLLLRIFVGESDKHGNVPLYEWIVKKAQENHLAGATVIQGIQGFGAHSRLHTAKVLRLSLDLPVIVEIVDLPEKINAFLEIIDHAIPEGLATVQDVEVRFYRPGQNTEKKDS